jgi:hypothetical protein
MIAELNKHPLVSEVIHLAKQPNVVTFMVQLGLGQRNRVTLTKHQISPLNLKSTFFSLRLQNPLPVIDDFDSDIQKVSSLIEIKVGQQNSPNKLTSLKEKEVFKIGYHIDQI